MVDTHIRKNFIEWLPKDHGQTILEVADDLSNLEGSWDYLVVTKAFARVPALLSGENPYESFWELLKHCLAPGGHVILAVDNQFGLKYFAGCKEKLTGKYFEGLEGYSHTEGTRTFSREAILDMAQEAGFEGRKVYYPYPDYEYMTALYSDAHLPSPGELVSRPGNFEEERVVLFDESKVFDQLILEGRFQEFSNSCLFDLTLERMGGETLLFCKYSVERAERFRIRTDIVRKEDGTPVVRKVPQTEAAKAHVAQLKIWEKLLNTQYEKAGIRVNHCTMTGTAAEFEFLHGQTFERLLDEFLAKKDYQGMVKAIGQYVERLNEALAPKPFVATEEFRTIFGNITFDTPQLAADLNNIDWIFPNIILENQSGDCVWNIIDYEWTFDFPIPVKFIIHRAITLYSHAPRREELKSLGLSRMFGISEAEEEKFLEMEHRLQLYLLEGTKTMAALQQEYAGKTIAFDSLMRKAHQPEMKIYLDLGAGFSEENSYVLEADEDRAGRRSFDLELPAGITALRLDPCEEQCAVTVNRLLGECGGTYECRLKHNGRMYKDRTIVYTTKDPQLIAEEIISGSSRLHVDLTVEYLKEETAYTWMELMEKAEKADRITNSGLYRFLKKIKNKMFQREKRKKL